MEWLKQASTSAEKSDAVFFLVFGISLLFLLFITALMIFFVVRYSRKRHPKAEQIEGHTGLEIVWTVVPLVIFLAIFSSRAPVLLSVVSKSLSQSSVTM